MWNSTVDVTGYDKPIVVYGNVSREVWRSVSRQQDNAKARSHTKRGPGRMPFRRRRDPHPRRGGRLDPGGAAPAATARC